MLNAAAALATAQEMFVQIQPSSSTGLPGQKIKLDGSGSTAPTGETIVGWQWSTNPATSGQLLDANQPVAYLVVPTFRSIEVMLTVTDSAGEKASAITKIQSAIGAASGAGGLDLTLLALLAAAAAWKLHQSCPRSGRSSG